MKPIIVLVISILSAVAAHGQSSSDSVKIVRLRLRPVATDLRSTPFGEVQVLDNRYDSSLLDVGADGKSIPYVGFGQPLAAAVQAHLQRTIDSLPKGNKSLLLNITEFRMDFRNGGMRGLLVFWVDAYYKTGENAYRKIMSARYQYSPRQNLEESLSWLLDRILAVAGNFETSSLPPIHGRNNSSLKIFEKDYVTYYRDTTQVSLAEINRACRYIWNDYPIMAQSLFVDGTYRNFDDLKKNEVTVGSQPIRMEFDPKDSVYRVVRPKKKKWYQAGELSVAVAYKGELYIKPVPGSHTNRFLKAEGRDGTYYFHIPLSLPNLPAMEELERIAGRNGPDIKTKNLLALLIVPLAEGAVLVPMNAADSRKAHNRGLPEDHRDCFVDMNNGDILCN